jgi:hypothetical protein
MANALVVHKDKLPRSLKMLRAVQYVRMAFVSWHAPPPLPAEFRDVF